MMPPIKSSRPSLGSRDASEDSDASSNHLWVGNIAPDVTDAELTTLFGKFGALDSVSAYSARNFAFIYYKRTEDAKAAKDALQGSSFHGHPLKIEFAKPGKPSKRLWVGGIGLSVSKEELEQEFLKFGKIDDFRFIRERNIAFIDYSSLEDASQALKSMNGKRIGGELIRVDFFRVQPSRRESWVDFRDVKESQFFSRGIGLPESHWIAPDFSRNHPEPSHVGSRRHLHPQPLGGHQGDGEPSNVLWICYPPSVHIDEQMLHNAMILFGEIERIKCFPERHYSFVEFRSVDEARLAKEKLQGRLFGDPHIMILYPSNELMSGKDSGFFQGVRVSTPDTFANDPLYRPAHIDTLGPNHARVPNSLSGSLPLPGGPGPHILKRPLCSQGNFEPLVPGPEYSDFTTVKMQDANPKNLVGGPNWKRSPAAPGILSPLSSGMRSSDKSVTGAWDVFDASLLRNDAKRPRVGGNLPVYDASFPIKDDITDKPYGIASHGNEDSLVPIANFQGMIHRSPVSGRFTSSGTAQGRVDQDYIWRGVIAKGGTPVCHARCIPVGDGFNFEIPEVVNCSARTGLDLLTKHHAEAVGFSVVFFLPDSEDDFASYTEFLRYLGAKNRAGVAKFNDGTTLFLVPPSDFLTKVLHVSGPERLYGVVLKFPEAELNSTSMPSQPLQPQYIDRQQMPRSNYDEFPSEEKVSQVEFNKLLPDDAKHHLKPAGPQTSGSFPVHSVAPINTPAVSNSGVTLTPELIATLTSLLPAGKSSGLESAQPALAAAMSRPLSTPAHVPHQGPKHEWGHEHQALDQIGSSLQQVGQFNSQGQLLPQLQAYPSISNIPSYPTLSGGSQIQDPSNFSQQATVSSRLTANTLSPSPGGQFAVSSQVDQNYLHGIPRDTQNGHLMRHGADAFGLSGSSIQQSKNSVPFYNQAHVSDISSSHSVLPAPVEQATTNLPNQVQQLQPAQYEAAQSTSNVEVDKNLRYQSTLQFAANLLFQIQQQQQQSSGSQPGQGSSNQ